LADVAVCRKDTGNQWQFFIHPWWRKHLWLYLKRSLGFKYQAAEYELGKLDKIAFQRDERSIGIKKGFADEVCAKQPGESDKSRNNRIHLYSIRGTPCANLGLLLKYIPEFFFVSTVHICC
jgi:hypothetical protein